MVVSDIDLTNIPMKPTRMRIVTARCSNLIPLELIT